MKPVVTLKNTRVATDVVTITLTQEDAKQVFYQAYWNSESDSIAEKVAADVMKMLDPEFTG